MYLDDQLYEIAKETDMTNANSIKSNLNSMVKAAFAFIDNQNIALGKEFNPITCFHRVDNYWRLACQKLKKQGVDLVNPNGFKILCQSKEEFKGIFKD